MKNITVLGSTGSIGVSTLDVLSLHTEQFNVVALSAYSQVDRMLQQCKTFLPDIVVMVQEKAAEELNGLLTKDEKTQHIKVLSGANNLDVIASMEQTDYVMAAIVGGAGLSSSMAAAKAGKRILLANKESLVMSGDLFMQTVKQHHAELLPVDSEHNAIFQALPENYSGGFKEKGIIKLLLTASGGPFRQYSLAQLAQVTPTQACAHPNWKMGAKISVDSASMMNKGLEVIEASWLFNIPAEYIEVVIHPQSIIHSMVSYNDGSVVAQLGNPDMKTPIAYALAWPKRMDSGVKQLDLCSIKRLDFEKPDLNLFPCLKLAYQAQAIGGSAVTTLNAANEIAVQQFLQGKISFLSIAKIIDYCLETLSHGELISLDAVFERDHIARATAEIYIQNNKKQLAC